jgi:hypothetical protein
MAMKWREGNRAKWMGFRPAHDGVQVSKSGHTDNVLLIVHTVTAGKTLHITNLIAGGNSGGVASGSNIYVRDTADAVVYYFVQQSTPANSNFLISLSLFHPIEVPSGYDICIISSAATARTDLYLHGWEENA